MFVASMRLFLTLTSFLPLPHTLENGFLHHQPFPHVPTYMSIFGTKFLNATYGLEVTWWKSSRKDILNNSMKGAGPFNIEFGTPARLINSIP